MTEVQDEQQKTVTDYRFTVLFENGGEGTVFASTYRVIPDGSVEFYDGLGNRTATLAAMTWTLITQF